MASERIPDRLKTQKMCSKTLKDDTYYLQFVPDWFVTQQQLKIWHDNDDKYNNDELIEWYEGHQKRKAKKAKIKEELLPIAWHPDRVMIGACQKTRRGGGSNIVVLKLSDQKITGSR